MKTIAPLPLARLEANHAHVEAFKALAHLSRLQVFFFLVRAGKEMSVGEIQEAVEIPGPTLSHHLDVLRRLYHLVDEYVRSVLFRGFSCSKISWRV